MGLIREIIKSLSIIHGFFFIQGTSFDSRSRNFRLKDIFSGLETLLSIGLKITISCTAHQERPVTDVGDVQRTGTAGQAWPARRGRPGI